MLPVNANILRQVYYLKYGNSEGTAFLIFYNDEEYVITAKHLFPKPLKCGSSIKLHLEVEKSSENYAGKYYIHKDTSLDIAVIKLNKKIKVLETFKIDHQAIIGQDVYFLGYPQFNKTKFNTSHPDLGIIPFVKKGILSAISYVNKYNLYYLDGQNNPGFSGGPVVIYDIYSKSFKILGVVSGYFNEPIRVKGNQGEIYNEFIETNSGIMLCFPIDIAREIIEQEIIK